ncbi:LacI family DNA-binding transcriptional regulator [Rhizobium sp. P32RR-XVIII]|uniref:LacI family DNA-binding transcriptional regulator n=1 Tax=Rhizobium sp. P32RR-XVIII TaxID=2726738 RepID=UPI001FF03526|nr:substrate-binding domain-containing protein [Rhizobium sp. P32RR-XVIII]
MNRTSAIGVLVADVANPSVADHLRGIDDVTMRENLSVILCNTDDIASRQLTLMEGMRDRNVDGMILISQRSRGEEFRSLMSDVPFVLMHRRSVEFPDPYVGTDNHQAIKVVMDHLIDLGHTRIALVEGPQDSSTVQERQRAYRAIVRLKGLDDDEALIIKSDYGLAAGREAAEHVFKMRHRPTAVIASNDMNALGFLEAAREMNVRIPEDMSLTGADDIPFAQFSGVELTTTRPPRRKMGVCAAEMLVRMIKGENLTGEAHIFSTELVIRRTTANSSDPTQIQQKNFLPPQKSH